MSFPYIVTALAYEEVLFFNQPQGMFGKSSYDSKSDYVPIKIEVLYDHALLIQYSMKCSES